MPNAHANNAATAVVLIYRQDVTRHTYYTAKALLNVLNNDGDKQGKIDEQQSELYDI
jgi:hypothetical protein